MFVFNDCRTDSRVLREAGSLAVAGHQVTIIARPSDAASTVGEREEREGFSIVRVPIPPGHRLFRLWLRYPWRIVNWAHSRARGGLRRLPRGVVDIGIAGLAVLASIPLSLVRGPFYLLARYRNRTASAGTPLPARTPDPARARRPSPVEWLVRWRWVIGAWARSAAAAAGPADVYHGHDLTGLAAAIAAADLHRSSKVVYDSHEIYLEAGANADQPGWLRRLMAGLERRWMSRSAALVTVNDSLAAELGRRYGPVRTVVVHNCPPRSNPPSVGVDLIRAATGIPADEPIALYHGAFSRHRGLEELAAAVAEPGLERAHAVFLGYGGLRADLDAIAAGPVAAGRVHVLPAVPPDELGGWVASADVGVMAIQPSTINHRMSTPNKLFECLAAGVPVVASDFPEMRQIVCGDPAGPLGVVDPAGGRPEPRPGDPLHRQGPAGRAGRAPGALPARRARALELGDRVGRPRPPVRRDRRDTVTPGHRDAGTPQPPASPVRQRAVIVLPSTGTFDGRAHRIAAGLAGRGHEVTVLARPGPGLPADSSDPSGYRIRRAGRGVPPGTPAPLRQIRQLGAIASQRAAAVGVTSGPLDIVHAMGLMGLPVGAAVRDRLGGALIYDARDLYPEAGTLARLPGPARRLAGAVERRWARTADRVVTVNDALADLLRDRLRCERPLVVLNASPIRPSEGRRPRLFHEALGLRAGTPIVLYQGGFSPGRGIPELLDAIVEVTGAHLVFLGYGRLEVALRARAARADLAGRVSILPAVPPGELLDWVASADVVAIPIQGDTLNHRLATPNKLFEALAAGVPVVASDLPGMAPIVRELQAGVLVDPTSPAAIAAGIRALLEPTDVVRKATRARIRDAAAGRYDWPSQLNRLLAEYTRLTGRPW